MHHMSQRERDEAWQRRAQQELEIAEQQSREDKLFRIILALLAVATVAVVLMWLRWYGVV